MATVNVDLVSNMSMKRGEHYKSQHQPSDLPVGVVYMSLATTERPDVTAQ